MFHEWKTIVIFGVFYGVGLLGPGKTKASWVKWAGEALKLACLIVAIAVSVQPWGWLLLLAHGGGAWRVWRLESQTSGEIIQGLAFVIALGLVARI